MLNLLRPVFDATGKIEERIGKFVRRLIEDYLDIGSVADIESGGKFISSFRSNLYVLSEEGYVPITHIHKTKKFVIFNLQTENHNLSCADEHLVISENGEQVYVKDLRVGDRIRTDLGVESVISVTETQEDDNMYDLSVDSPSHLYYTNGILSHNSTISTVFITHYILFNQDKNVAILANNEKTAREILRRIKYAYAELPLWMQSGIKEWNKGSMSFDNDVKVFAGSTGGTASRGESISLLYLDEFAFVAPHVADDFMASVIPTISSSDTSKIIIVSTPNGMNHYFRMWRDAVAGLQDPSKGNGFKPIRINWDEVPDRNETFKEKMIKVMGLPKWNQEFAGKFVGSTNTLVNPEILERMPIKDPLSLKIGDSLYVYEYPEEGVTYIMGVDSAKGNMGDFSVINVLRINDQYDVEQVAVYRSNSKSPNDFAQVCIEVSNYYNNCYMMVENNDVGEIVANHIWYDYECDRILNCDQKGIGIRSTRKTKLAANLLLKRYMDSGYLSLCDQQTMYELTRYEEVSPDVFKAAGQNEHDDCVTSLLWALYFLNTEFYDSKSNEVKLESKNKIEPDDGYDDPMMFFDDGDNPIFEM